MPHRECDKILAAIFGEPWAIVPDHLDVIIAIASRTLNDREQAAVIREERAELIEHGRISAGPKTAVIPVFGPIFPRADIFSMISGATSVDRLTARIDDAVNDPEVEGIVLDFDTPGGQVTGIHELARHIAEANREKPITAYVSGMAASAGYWLASATGRIVADRTATVGSIGVVTAWTDDSAARKAQGLKDYVLVSSQSPNKYLDPKTPAGRREIQERIDAIAAVFIGEVAEFRDVSRDRVENDFGRGGVMLADPALDAGMIDEIGAKGTAMAVTAPRSRTAASTGGIEMHGNKNAMAVAKKKNAAEEEDEEEAKKASKAKKDEEEDEAAEDEDEHRNEHEDDDKKPAKGKEKALAKIRASNPDIYDAAFSAGIACERARLQEIRELGIVGHKSLLDKAMFTEPMSAEELAMACVKADNKERAVMAKARLDDAADAFVPPSAVEPGQRTGDTVRENAMIAAMAGKVPEAM